MRGLGAQKETHQSITEHGKAQTSTNKSRMSANKPKQAQSGSRDKHNWAGTSTTEQIQMSKDKQEPANKQRQVQMSSKGHEWAVISTRASQYNWVGTNRDQQKNGDKYEWVAASMNKGWWGLGFRMGNLQVWCIFEQIILFPSLEWSKQALGHAKWTSIDQVMVKRKSGKKFF